MPNLPNGTKLANTPMWAIALSKIANRHLEQDDRIPNHLVRFFVQESDEGTPLISVERIDMAMGDDEFKSYSDIAYGIFELNKESIFKEFESLE